MPNILSLSMIAKNSASDLKRCLESCASAFEEIVVVDTGSSDDTISVAKSFGAKVYDFPWIDDFAAARNFSLSKATLPYVMWLDCDDVLHKEDTLKLIELKKNMESMEIMC